MADPILALTLWPEWAWAITNLGKRVENRSEGFCRQIARRVGEGWLAIHAGVKPGDRLYLVANMYDAVGDVDAYDDPHLGGILWCFGGTYVNAAQLTRGAIVALVKVGNRLVTPDEDADWKAPGCAGIVLHDLRVLPDPIACKGAQGLWTPTPDVQERLRAALEADRG